jgi:hypothetical protein
MKRSFAITGVVRTKGQLSGKPSPRLRLFGTLIDSVYPHTLAWQQALAEMTALVPTCEIHRHIGISGRLLVKVVGARAGELSTTRSSRIYAGP